jgi:hypothetical protein
MKTLCLAMCSALLVLIAVGAVAQDTTCENFETETIACNDSNNTCSATHLENVIVGDNGPGYNHPVVGSLICTGSSACQSLTSYPLISVPNPYCTPPRVLVVVAA